jgi:hypothetical protein
LWFLTRRDFITGRRDIKRIVEVLQIEYVQTNPPRRISKRSSREEMSSAAAEGPAVVTGRLERHDSLYGDAEKVASREKYDGSGGSWARTLQLAFQSIGVVYGDIGTSPLYVYSSTFPGGIRHPDDIIGVLSLILYTLIILPMLKYVFIVLKANDNGDGEIDDSFLLLALVVDQSGALAWFVMMQEERSRCTL